MEALRETTKWAGSSLPGHIYLFDGTKAVAYIKWGQGEPFYFKKPLQIDKKGRTFVKADRALFGKQPKSQLIAVAGSKGQTYYVDPDAQTCTCPGFQFKGSCKHLAAVSV